MRIEERGEGEGDGNGNGKLGNSVTDGWVDWGC